MTATATNATTIFPGRGMAPPRFNTAWRAVRQSHMDDEAIFQVTMVLPSIIAEMRTHWERLRDMGMAALYDWEAEKERAAGLAFHIIDRTPA
ncbi:hypothetical protein [Paracoccus sp. SY]|uniref:hypothetical protein n=1 Tax=Paracoccus sp. SY TaxID=1330255 RepID=UPI000CCFDCEA|nr:hypothetical protein [Paracoccus sp. SY]